MARTIMTVLTNPSPGAEDDFNAWYDGTHLPELLQIPGITAACRYRSAPGGQPPSPGAHRYLAIYELEGSAEAVAAALAAHPVTMSTAIDLATIDTTFWTATE